MTYQLPNPTSPNTSDGLTSLPVRQNFQSLASQMNSLDGSSVQAGTILEAALADSINPRIRSGEANWNFVASGINPSVPGSGLVVALPSGVVYVSGYRVSYPGGSVTVAASKDTYIDIDTTGTITQSAVTNGSASPSLSANRLRLMIIVSGASNVSSINQGLITATAPTVSGSVLLLNDSLGNRIGRRTPNETRKGLAFKTSQGDIIPNAYTTYLTINAITAGSSVDIEYGANVRDGGSGAARTGHVRVQVDGSTVSGSDIIWGTSTSGSSGVAKPSMIIGVAPSAGLHTFTLQVEADTASASFLDQAYLRIIEQ